MGNSDEFIGGKKRTPALGCGFRALCNRVFRRPNRTLPRRPNSANLASRAAAKHAPLSLMPEGEGSALSPLIVPPPAGTLPANNPQMLSQQQLSSRDGPRAATVGGMSVELDGMQSDNQRFSCGNLHRHNAPAATAHNLLNDMPRTGKGKSLRGKPRTDSSDGGTHSEMGKSPNEKEAPMLLQVRTMCRSFSRNVVPEELNHMGFLEYRKGRAAEALSFFEQATVVAPGRALYWNNKAVVLTGMGKLLEAVSACEEAVKIDPGYGRAHYRLATLYLRLGKAGNAALHYEKAGHEASTRDMDKARSLQDHLTKCSEACTKSEWSTMLKEAQSAIAAGAHSAPKVFALQAEAFLKLQMHQEAETCLVDVPTFDIDASVKFFGPVDSAYILAVLAQVDMSLGRFDDALSTAQIAARIDPANVEIAAVARRTCAVSLVTTQGNNLFKASKFGDACAAYGVGLKHDPQNSVMLCSRATCQSRLGQWEKAIEDCNTALTVRPSYKKARLRRADCYAKLERWEDSIQDYKVLIQQMPGDTEVLRALVKVHSQLKEGDEQNRDTSSCANMVFINMQ